MSRQLLPLLFAVFAICCILLSYLATNDVSTQLSPQGCRMSRMSPSYVLQSNLNASWTPLARRYSTWLYRESGWEGTTILGQHGVGSLPVLFIPGNAGSSNQARSIASSATRQFYSQPSVISDEFLKRGVKPLDFFAVDFNEDLSAFHGPTIDAQIAYTKSAIAYILSLYPAYTSIIIMGHSMGGVVATALLPSTDISAVITMSTPHTLPPARFDSRIDSIYRHNLDVLVNGGQNSYRPTPVLSLCGGATDMMIPSETCILPEPSDPSLSWYRRTVFTSALEGAWTGVGHREMVWCHQVRWRVARAALELAEARTPSSKAAVLDVWLRDGHMLPITTTHEGEAPLVDFETVQVMPLLDVRQPHGSQTYFIQAPRNASKFILFVSRGSIASVSPQNSTPLRVSVSVCTPTCNFLDPTMLKLIPNPVPGKMFPVPDEGSDESDGVVSFEGEMNADADGVYVTVEGGVGEGWVVGGFEKIEWQILNAVGTSHLMMTGVDLRIPRDALKTQLQLPNIISNTLLVYRLTPSSEADLCGDALLPPLIMHTSHAVETHYFPLHLPSRRILLHTHGKAPYVRSNGPSRGLAFDIYSSGCGGAHDIDIRIAVDWTATVARIATRYPTTLVTWSTAIMALIVFNAWGMSERSGGTSTPTVSQALTNYLRFTQRKLILASFLVAFIPFPEQYYIGTSGEPLFAIIAPFLLVVAGGLVCVSWGLLLILMWPLRMISPLFGRRREDVSVRKSALISMGLVFIIIFLFVPWQVAFLVAWGMHLYTCASLPKQPHHNLNLPRSPEDSPTRELQQVQSNNRNENMLILLLMTWLLPFAAPVLAVWVRTLITAGLTTPFDSDHMFLNAAPFLILVDFASWTAGPVFQRHARLEHVASVRWSLLLIAVTGFLAGSRTPYRVFDAGKIAVGLIVVVRIGPRYWGEISWFRPSPAGQPLF